MLMALLYVEDDRIAAAAAACDQSPYGDQFWLNFHAGEIVHGTMYETAYVEIDDPILESRLRSIGFDDAVDGFELAAEVEALANFTIEKAA